MSGRPHQSIDIQRIDASQSEEQLAELEMRTRARIGALLTALGVLHVTGIALNLVGPSAWSWHQACASVGIAVHIASLIMTGICIRYARQPDLSVARLVDLVLVYEVLTALGIGFAEQTRPVHGISFVAILIAFFPLFVTASPRRTLIAALLAATMPLVAHTSSLYLTGSHRLSWVGYLPYALNYLFAGFAVVPAKIMRSLAHDVRAARRLGAYQLIEKLGAGGMGEVWKAKHRLLRRPAAIKLIRFRSKASDPGVRRRLLQRFEREAQVTASLQSPHTVALYDFGVASDATFYHVMELLDGLDLETLVRKFGPIPPERAVPILLQACDAIEDAHRAGLVHRDIKPANIFLARLGHRTDFVKVLDFGLVKDRRPDTGDPDVWTTHANEVTGTPAFMAPEQVIGADPIDGRADIYALGCVAYWLLTGRLVFDEHLPMAMMVAHTTRSPTPPSKRTKLEIPPALEALILSCLAKDPADRPQSAKALTRALEALDLPDWSPEQARAWWRLHMPERAEAISGMESTAEWPLLADAS